MKRLLKMLSISTLVLPLFTGAVAVIAKFGDPWGMGADDPWGIFLSAALPILVPGYYQIFIWPITYGVAVLLSPLVLVRQKMYFLIPVSIYLIFISTFWVFNWLFSYDNLNLLLDGQTYQPGNLNHGVKKIGIMLLTNSALLLLTLVWWWRNESK